VVEVHHPVYERFNSAEGYQCHALVAQTVPPTVGTRSYHVTTVVPSSVEDQLTSLRRLLQMVLLKVFEELEITEPNIANRICDMILHYNLIF